MNDKKPSWIVLLLALFSAALAPTALQHALEPGGAKGEPAKDPKLEEGQRARETDATLQPWEEFLCSYFFPRSRADKRYCEPRYTLPVEARFLIAGVPDPEVTSVPATFDVMVESIIRAAAQHNWKYDRYWIPWSPGKRPWAAPTAADPVQASNEPGLLLFRRSDSALVVFLVGETPTSGVNKTAFVNAADFILNRMPPNTRLPVLGPRFSGSVESYRLALRALEKRTNYWGADFVTGSATRFDNKAEFESESAEGREVTYSAAVENDARATELFLRWLKTRGISRAETAILAEAGTAFGAAQGDRKGESLLVEFPYQISRLRNAYDQDPELRAIWMGRSKEARQQRLDWSMRTEKEGTDRLPSFNGPQTALGQEREMEQIMESIQRRGIRAVGISATDMLDTVFLSIMLQRNCPGVRTFVLDSDLLFLYSTPALSFHGMLMVSPYPLWPENQSILHSDARKLLTFPNRSAEAVVNAFTLLMTGAAPREYGSPAKALSRKPPLWVTAVGRGEVRPIALLAGNDKAPASTLAESPEEVRSVPPPPLRPHWSYLLLLLVCTGITFYGGWIYLQRRLHSRFPQGGWDRSYFFLFEPPDDSEGRTVYLQAACAFGATALLPFLFGGWAAAGSVTRPWVWIALVAVAVNLIVFAHVTARAARRWVGIAAAAILIALTAGSWLSWIGFASGPGDSETMERYFSVYRMLSPLSGVSPLAGFVLPWFGACWWAISKFNQLRTYEVRSPRLVDWPADEPLLAETGAAIRGACRNAEGITHPHLAIPFSIWVFSLYWIFGNGALSGLEPEPGMLSWTACVQTAFLLLSLFVTFTAWQMLQTYRGLEALLKGFIDHPLAEAVGRLPKDLASSQLWVRGNNRFPFQTCVQGILRLRTLSRLAFPGAPDADGLAALEDRLKRLIELSAAGHRLPREEVAQLNRDFNAAAFALYPRLAAIWKGEVTPDDASAKAEEFVALRIAALVRYLVMQMRSMLEYLSLAVLLFILSVVSYPFEPQQNLIYWAAGIAAGCGSVTFYVVGRLDVHPVLQPLNAKAHGGGSMDLIRKLILYGGAPAIAALGALFPGSARSLQTLLEQLPKLLGGG